MNELELLRQADPARGPMPSEGRAELLANVQALPSEKRRRRRTAAVGICGLIFSLAGGGIAFAVLSGQPPATALSVECAVGGDRSAWDEELVVGSSMNTITGDPVADCAAEYVRLEGAAPALSAYSKGNNNIEVIPADWPAPADWLLLPKDFRVDSALLELSQRLQDILAGVETECRSLAQAQMLVQSFAEEVGLVGWTTELLPTPVPDGVSTCAYAITKPGTDVVLLGAHPVEQMGNLIDVPGYPKLGQMVAELRATFPARCLSLPEAARIVREIVLRSEARSVDTKLPAMVDATARCSRVVVIPAGLTVVVVRGPEVATPSRG